MAIEIRTKGVAKMMNTNLKVFLVGSFFLVSSGFAATPTVTLKAKVLTFDQQSVTLEIANESYRFSRSNLGKDFANLKKGEPVKVVVELPPPPAPKKK